MKICIDVRCLAEGRTTGVEEYTFNLLRNLFEIDKHNQYVLFFNSWHKSKVNFSWIEKYPQVKLKKFHFPNKILNLFFWYLHWPKIDRLVGGADIVFMPNIIFGSVSQKTKLIITIHDLSYERYSEYFSFKKRWWHIFVNPKKICYQANKIIAISHSTKDDLITLYGIKPSKIKVIYSACSNEFKVVNRNSSRLIKVKEKYALPYKFIMFLGTIEPRKNIISLIRAFDYLQSWAKKYNQTEIQKFNLVIAGAKGWLNKKIYEEIKKARFKKKIKLVGFVANQDKKYFYNLASLFVFPSFFEGFGFPPLEAMSCGVPVIVGNNSSLPEIVKKAGILIEADRPDEIAPAMREILKNKELKAALVKRGLKVAKEFSWKKTAQETLETFKTI